MVNRSNLDTEIVEQIVVGWSPHGPEEKFSVTPTRFARYHNLHPAQAGIVRFLSRYQFEKNPWLIDQSCLLAELIIEFGNEPRFKFVSWLQQKFGGASYLAKKIPNPPSTGMSVSNYCIMNGISSEVALPLGLICNSPTRANILKAIELMKCLKDRRKSGSLFS